MGKIACITGASKGLGREYSYQLAKKGYNLKITARSQTELDQLKSELESNYNVHVDVIVADLTTREGITSFENAIKSSDDLEVLINNAGFALIGSFTSLPVNKQIDMMELHMKAPIIHSYAAIPLMRNHGTGYIINVSSLSAFLRKPRSGLYGPTKSFLLHFSKGLHRHLRKDNIYVQALCPGYVRTQMHRTEEFKKINYQQNIPQFLWLDAPYVVETSLNNLKKKIVIPSLKYKIIRYLVSWGIISW